MNFGHPKLGLSKEVNLIHQVGTFSNLKKVVFSGCRPGWASGRHESIKKDDMIKDCMQDQNC